MDLIGIVQFLARAKISRDCARHRSSHNAGVPEAAAPQSGAEAISADRTVLLGTELSGRPCRVAVQSLCAPGLVGGATGAGKSVGGIINPVRAIRAAHGTCGVGLIDNKGDTFEALADMFASDGLRPPVTLDFTAEQPVRYGLLAPRVGERVQELVDRRMDVFDDLLGRDARLSLLMSRMLRNLLLLMTEQRLPFPLIDLLMASRLALHRLAEKSALLEVREYIRNDFDRERQTTGLALKARLDSILRHRVLRLSLAADEAIDLRDAMDQGETVLANAGGPMMPAAASRLIKSMLVSDIKQATFRREQRDRPFVWFIDEAQTLFADRSNIDNIMTMLAMARAFGTSLVLVTQSLVAVSPDQDFLTSLETNFRWLLLFRSGLRDAAMIEPALPVTGRSVSRRNVRGAVSYFTPDQERAARLRTVTNLQPRTAFFWARGTGRPATLLTMPTMSLRGLRARRTSTDEGLATSIQLQLDAHVQRLRELEQPHRQKRSAQDIEDVLSGLERQLRGVG